MKLKMIELEKQSGKKSHIRFVFKCLYFFNNQIHNQHGNQKPKYSIKSLAQKY